MSKTDFVTLPSSNPAHVDSGAIRLGGTFRLPAAPAEVADTGKIRLGGTFRLVA